MMAAISRPMAPSGKILYGVEKVMKDWRYRLKALDGSSSLSLTPTPKQLVKGSHEMPHIDPPPPKGERGQIYDCTSSPRSRAIST
jgi:hypothetical protein